MAGAPAPEPKQTTTDRTTVSNGAITMIQNNYNELIFKVFPSKKEISVVKDQPIIQFGGASSVIKKKKENKERLNPEAQQAILEIQTVREIQNKVDYANAFIMRYQKIIVNLEDAV